MKKSNPIKYVFFSVMIILFCILAFYLLLSVYYKNGFSYNTWINGVYCTGKSVNEVNEELLAQSEHAHTEQGGVLIYDLDGNSYLITTEEIELQHDYTESLALYLNRQNPYLWIDHIAQTGEGEKINPIMSYNKEKLTDCVEALPFFAEDAKKPDKELKIKKTKQGYQLINERTQALNREKALAVITQRLEQGNTIIDLKQEGCYEDLPLTQQMADELEIWEQVEEFQDCKIVYQMGEDFIPIDASVVGEWIAVGSKGNFLFDVSGKLILNEEKIVEFISALAEEYDTVGTARTFQTTAGKNITVEGGIYGNQLDQETEIVYTTEAFLEKREEVHEPAYLQTALQQGKEDIGDTYIEVDMTAQKMYYYEAGKLLIETEVVTGNTSKKWGTPEGVNYVYAKQTNRILRGEGYASPVKYWLPVNGNIGIHDASWRKTFGDEIYKTDGSHGCINTPPDKVSKLYELVEIGTPCVMFY